jgi:hypothetical protein
MFAHPSFLTIIKSDIKRTVKKLSSYSMCLHDARIISSGVIIIFRTDFIFFSIQSIINLAVVFPSISMGCLIVVKGGVRNEANFISSNPITDKSTGIFMFFSCAALYTPTAM